MDVLMITDDGRQSVNDFRSLKRACLVTLYEEPKKVLELANEVRTNFPEFRHIQTLLFAKTLAELQRQGLVESKYGDFV